MEVPVGACGSCLAPALELEQGLEASRYLAILYVPDSGAVLRMNAAAYRCFGYDASHLPKVELTQLLPHWRAPSAKQGGGTDAAGFRGQLIEALSRKGREFLVELIDADFEQTAAGAVGLIQLADLGSDASMSGRDERFQRLLADSYGATMIILEDGTIKYATSSVRGILGYAVQDFVGKNVRGLHHPADRKRIRAFVRDLPRDGRLKHLSNRMRHADGSYRYIESSLRNLTLHPDVGGILVNCRDVTERVEAEQEVQRRRDEVQLLARYRTMAELGSAIAHELNQPVSAIRNYAAGCLRSMDSENGLEGVRWGLEQIAAEAERAARIMRSVHNFTTHKKIERRVMPVEEIVEDIAAFLTLKADEADARLAFDVKSGLQAWCDKTLVGQVILNLALNGLDAMQGTPPEARQLVVAAMPASAGFVEIVVNDTGAGMTKEQLNSLFQARVSTKERGLGLGLMLSRSVVTNHGGEIWARSESGIGTSFHFTLRRRSQRSSVFGLS